MRKFAALFLTVLLFSIQSARTIPLPELVNPDSIQAGYGRIAVTDGESVYLFSLENFRLIKKFGKKGEGPREFRFPSGGVEKLHLVLTNLEIIVNSQNRVTFFTLNGDYLRELNPPSGQHFIPLGKKFAGYSVVNEKSILYLTINLYDQDLKFQREIFRKDYYVQPSKRFDLIRIGYGNKRRAHYQVYKDKLYVEGENVIHVFDPDGKILSLISPDYRREKIGSVELIELRKEIGELFPSPLMQKLIRENGYFPEYFPVRAFLISDDMFYIPTYSEQNGKTKFYVAGLDGRNWKAAFFPFRSRSFLIPFPFTISDGKMIQLTENGKTEEWEMVISEGVDSP